MEQVAPAATGGSKGRITRGFIALATLLTVIMIVVSSGLLAWALSTALAHPLALLAAPAILLLPGAAALRLLWPSELAPAERWPLAVGLSVALVPIVVLLSSLVGLRWSAGLGWLWLACCALVVAWPGRAQPWNARVRAAAAFRPDTAHLTLLAITGLALVLRLYVVRDLPAGLLGDSYHHTVITQLIVDNGGLFSSWEPYAPIRTLTYHFGFHSNAAWFSMLSGMPATKAVLVVGQLYSALAAPLVYVFTRRLLGSERAGLWAAIVVGFLSPMPAYYVNWGRYTQLGGQLILPAACVAWMALMEAATPHVSRGRLARLGGAAALLTAGLTLTHYRVAVFAACFVAAYALYIVVARRRSPRAILWLAGAGLASGAASGLLVLPWLLRLRASKLLMIGGYFLSNNVGTDTFNTLADLQGVLSLYARDYLVALALLGCAALLWRRTWRVLVILLWAALVWIAANPYLVGLNGAGIISNFAVLIASYLALAPLAGAALAGAIDELFSLLRRPEISRMAQATVGVAALAWSLGWQRNIITPQTQLVFPADIAAMDWIQQETPSNARFFVNSFPSYGGGVFAGTDGGWWLPFLSGRASNIPPITYGTEAGPTPDYQMEVKADNEAILTHDLASPEGAAALKAAGYTYLYDGPANTADPAFGERILPAALAGSPLYKEVYSSGGVTIWQVR